MGRSLGEPAAGIPSPFSVESLTSSVTYVRPCSLGKLLRETLSAQSFSCGAGCGTFRLAQTKIPAPEGKEVFSIHCIWGMVGTLLKS